MPEVSLAYLDKALTQVSLYYRNSALAMLNLFPRVPVDLPSSKYWVYGFEAFHLFDDARRPGAIAKEMPDWNLSNAAYNAEEHALRRLIPDQVKSAAQVNIDVVTTQQLTDALLLKGEVKAHSLLSGGAVPNTTLSGTSQWSDFTNSNPIAAVEAQKSTIYQAVAKLPNTLAVSYNTHAILRQHPLIIDRFKYTDLPGGVLTEGQLRTAFGVDNYMVLSALYDTAAFGNVPSLNYVWGNDALLAYIPPEPAQMEVSLGYSFWWTYGAPQNGGALVRRYRVEERKGDMVEAEAYYDLQVVAPGAGFYWINAVNGA